MNLRYYITEVINIPSSVQHQKKMKIYTQIITCNYSIIIGFHFSYILTITRASLNALDSQSVTLAVSHIPLLLQNLLANPILNAIHKLEILAVI